MRIAIVSATPLPRFGRAPPTALLERFARERIERILHAGDWTTPLALDLLEAVAPVDSVAGNNDGPELHESFGTRRGRELDGFVSGLGTRRMLELDGLRSGLTHGHLGEGRPTQERVRNMFADEAGLQAIVCGHSH